MSLKYTVAAQLPAAYELKNNDTTVLSRKLLHKPALNFGDGQLDR